MNGSDLRDQQRMARDFAWTLGDVWTRRSGRPSAVNVLDALVASGYRLVEDAEGVASATLFTTVPDVVRTGNAA